MSTLIKLCLGVGGFALIIMLYVVNHKQDLQRSDMKVAEAQFNQGTADFDADFERAKLHPDKAALKRAKAARLVAQQQYSSALGGQRVQEGKNVKQTNSIDKEVDNLDKQLDEKGRGRK